MNEWNEYEWISEELPKVLRFPKTPDARRESRLGDIDDIMDAEPEISEISRCRRCELRSRFYDSTFLDRVGDLAWPWRRHFARSGSFLERSPRVFFNNAFQTFQRNSVSLHRECVLPPTDINFYQTTLSCLYSSEILPKAEHLAFSAAPCKLQRCKQNNRPAPVVHLK